jgi:hypothetical protein
MTEIKCLDCLEKDKIIQEQKEVPQKMAEGMSEAHITMKELYEVLGNNEAELLNIRSNVAEMAARIRH